MHAPRVARVTHAARRVMRANALQERQRGPSRSPRTESERRPARRPFERLLNARLQYVRPIVRGHRDRCGSTAARTWSPGMEVVYLAAAVLFFVLCDLFVARGADRL